MNFTFWGLRLNGDHYEWVKSVVIHSNMIEWRIW